MKDVITRSFYELSHCRKALGSASHWKWPFLKAQAARLHPAQLLSKKAATEVTQGRTCCTTGFPCEGALPTPHLLLKLTQALLQDPSSSLTSLCLWNAYPSPSSPKRWRTNSHTLPIFSLTAPLCRPVESLLQDAAETFQVGTSSGWPPIFT